MSKVSTLIREYVWFEGKPIAVIEGGVVYYVRSDHIGKPVFATDATGAKVWEATYLPFGGVHTSSGANITLRFPGQWFQSESGLHQNWMRDYDPTTGRYLQADPLGLVDGASVYGYVGQNPNRYTDQRGEFGVAGAAVGGISNLLFQTIVNYAKYGNLTTALRCVDIKDVVASAAFGFLGASPLTALRNGRRYGAAAGTIGVTTWTKKITVPTPIRIGDECECSNVKSYGGFADNFLSFFASLQF